MRTRVPTVRKVVLICLSILFSLQVFPQSISTAHGRIEVGAGIGPVFFLGDLGGTRGLGRGFVKDVNFPTTRMIKGLYLNIYPAEWIGFRFAANIGELNGADSLIKPHNGEEMYRKMRNLDFRTNLSEAYAAIELYPTVLLEKYDGLLHKIRPYAVFGVGMFHFNPQGSYTDPYGRTSWVDLKPLRLEGQGMAEYPNRKSYSLTQLEIPMGVGAKFYFSESMYLGFEILHRKTFTDYIDDVSTTYIDPALFDVYLTPSQAIIAKQMEYKANLLKGYVPTTWVGTQRGNPAKNDAYFSALIRFGWRINAGYTSQKVKRQMKCPHYF